MRIYKALKANVIKSIEVARPFCSKKGLKLLADQLYDANHSDGLKALSAAIGVFLGIIPIWGFQTLSAIFLATAFRLNKALVLIFSHISLPPLLPLVIFLSYRAGSYWMGNSINPASPSKISVQSFNSHLQQYILGSLTLAMVAAVITGLLTYGILKAAGAVKQYRQAAVLKRERMVSFAELSGLMENSES